MSNKSSEGTTLSEEIDRRIVATRALMSERGYDALLIYGSNKVNGSLRYLTDYFPDRAGWISLSATETLLVEGGAGFLSQKQEMTLLVDPGLMPMRDVVVKRIIAADGFSARKDDGLSAKNIIELLKGETNLRRVGVETWDKFPAPLFNDIKAAFPGVEFVHSTVVEELRWIKSAYDLAKMRESARSADLAHEAVRALLGRGEVSEIELIRTAEKVMRDRNPMYEDSCTASPSLISSGTTFGGVWLHVPDHNKMVRKGDIVHWDLAHRYEGYPVDSSRTRSIGRAKPVHRKAYEISREMLAGVIDAIRPGVSAYDLVKVGDGIARKHGLELWNAFLGHGLGLDAHERPDMGIEETPIAENMVLAIEPRLLVEGYLIGNEDMVHVTAKGGVSLTHFDRDEFEIVD